MTIISSEKNMDYFFIVVFIAPWHQICTFQHGFDQDICYDLEYHFAHFRNIRVLRIDNRTKQTFLVLFRDFKL